MFWSIVLNSFLAGVVGTMFGAIIPLFVNINKDKVMALLMSLSSGFMLAVVFFDLVPESLSYGNIYYMMLGLLIGILIIASFDFLFKKYEDTRILEKKDSDGDSQYKKMGIVILFAIGLHNLPEGIAIGSKGVIDGSIALTLVIALHNIPEGIAMSMPFVKSGINKWKILFWCAMSGFPTVIGAMIGYGLGIVSTVLISVSLAIAAGAMLFVVINELLYDSFLLH
ncbi:MAG: ZIP family metal transporter, partial [Clostridia bacterium]